MMYKFTFEEMKEAPYLSSLGCLLVTYELPCPAIFRPVSVRAGQSPAQAQWSADIWVTIRMRSPT